MRRHLGIPAVSLLGSCGRSDGAEEPGQPESSFLLLLDVQVSCSWLPQGQAEVVHQGKVWKTQLRRGQHGKDELEGRDRL